MEEKYIYSPYKEYYSNFKNLIDESSQKYFEELLKKSSVDLELDKELKKEHDKILNSLDAQGKLLKKKKNLKTFLIILAVLFGLFSIFSIGIPAYQLSQGINNYVLIIFIVLGVVLFGLMIFLIIYISKKLNVLIKNEQSLFDKITEDKNNLEKRMNINMSSLNNLFDYNMPNEIISRAIPIIKLDKNFDITKYSYLMDKYNFDTQFKKDESILACQSGEIEGNPFLIYRKLNTYMGSKKYTGSIVVTVRYYDKEGHSHTRSETLTASLTKPYPYYFEDTTLVYANEAAPNLSFSRRITLSKHLEKKELDKFVKNKKKEFDKLATKELNKASGYTPLGNDTFEALFNCTDRDNEVEYRLLFTALAQNNLVELINSKEPYGDDFSYSKIKMLNFIQTSHSQTFNYSASPTYFRDLDVETVKTKFLFYVNEYFKNIYFDLAPIISIPELQQHKPFEYIYKKDRKERFNRFEIENICNSMDYSNLLNKESYFDKGILKTEFESSDENSDTYLVKAYSYKGTEMVDYIPVRASDGSIHNVPVKWIDFKEITQSNHVKVNESDSSFFDFYSNVSNNTNIKNNSVKDFSYKRGILGVLLNNKKGE